MTSALIVVRLAERILWVYRDVGPRVIDSGHADVWGVLEYNRRAKLLKHLSEVLWGDGGDDDLQVISDELESRGLHDEACVIREVINLRPDITNKSSMTRSLNAYPVPMGAIDPNNYLKGRAGPRPDPSGDAP
jgi:hypothetical protein